MHSSCWERYPVAAIPRADAVIQVLLEVRKPFVSNSGLAFDTWPTECRYHFKSHADSSSKVGE